MKKLLLSLGLLLGIATPAVSQDFFSDTDADRLFDFGVRVGVNTSNRNINNTVATKWNRNAWGTGFDAGVVANINLKNYISIQPGFFYETRSGSYAYQFVHAYDSDGAILSVTQTELGKGREYLFTIPIIGSLHFNVLDELRWNVDFGPYFQFKLRSTFDGSFNYPSSMNGPYVHYTNDVKTARCDIGFKMGISFDLFEHYYIGVHYLAGMLHAWNPGRFGGHNKAWMFTIGYNFYK